MSSAGRKWIGENTPSCSFWSPGLRGQEVAGLTLDDIDWKRERLAIPLRNNWPSLLADSTGRSWLHREHWGHVPGRVRLTPADVGCLWGIRTEVVAGQAFALVTGSQA